MAQAQAHPHPHPHQAQTNMAWMPVPQFGAWDQKDQASMNYSMIFSQARATRKQHKSDARRSLGNEHDFRVDPFSRRPREDANSVSKKKKILTYINCCIKP